jgi:Butirosin biosynthesis protein H, N-terminal/Domain of unknown function (DUF4872)
VATAARSVRIDLPHRRAGHCGSGAMRDLLEFHDLSWSDAPLSEGMVFGLGAGLGFAYVELAQMDPPFYLVGRGADLERDICEHLEIGLDLRQTDDPAEGWALLRTELDAGRPTMVWADIAHLEYLRVKLQMTMHDIVICGYDEGEGVASIADNDRDEIQRCSLQALARARNSHAFPAPNRHATWVMEFPAQLPDAATAIERAVARTVAHMRGETGSALTAATDTLGLAGVDTFARGFGGWPDRFGERLGAALRGLRVFVVKAGTGGALFRSLHAEFLTDAAALLGDQPLQDCAGVYAELSDAWVQLTARVEGDDALAAHAAGALRVARIAELEHAGVESMERWLAGRRDG